MATEVEERIVAAKFDSADFEKGVDKTVKKLDELKESLDFKKTGESLEKFGQKTTEATENASKSLEKLTDRFTTFTGMLKQKLLGGLADQVVNTFFRMEHAISGFFKSMSTGPMAAGMQKFESALTSVRMITASTYDEIDAATGKKTGKRLNYTQDSAYASIKNLQEYADETSYSMDQMVDAMSKMVSAGVGLEQAEKNVQGIANACAAAGVNASDAARAFFNLSQAYSSGSLKYTDYRSLQLLNMTNENFEEALIAAGVAAGTLVEKKGKNGQSVYKTKKTSKNGKVTAGKVVNRKNLSESLRFNWADNEVMDYLFGNKFFVDVEDFQKAKEYSKQKNGGIYKAQDALEYLKQMQDATGKIDKATGQAAKKYGDLAVNAFMAAREARNLTDVMNAVRDYVSSGWSQVFTKLFGELDKATEFFTQLSEGGIASIFTDGIDWINDVLDVWNEGDQGGEALRQTILQIDAAIGELFKLFGDLLPSTDEFGETLFNLSTELEFSSEQFQRWMESVREWFHEKDQFGISRITKIQTAIANLTGVFSVFRKLTGIMFNTFNKTLDLLTPVFDALFDGLVKLTQPIGDLGSGKNSTPFDALTDSITNMFQILTPIVEKIGPFVTQLGSILGDVGAFFLQMSIDTLSMNIQFFADAIGMLLEALGLMSSQKTRDGVGVIGGIKQDFESLGDIFKTLTDSLNTHLEKIKSICTQAKDAVQEFFTVLLSDLRKLFGLTDTSENVEDGGAFAGIKNFFDSNEFILKANAWIDKAKNDIVKWFGDLPQTINNFITGLLYEKHTNTVFDQNGNNIATAVTYVETPLKQWLDTAVESVSKFVAEIPSRLLEGVGTVGNFISLVIDAIFGGEKAGTKNKKEVNTKKQEDQTTNAVKEWADKFSKKFQGELKLLPIRIRYYINKTKRAIQNSFKTIKTWFDDNETIKAIKEWGASIYDTIKDFILKLPEHIKNIIKSVGATGRSIISVIKELFSSDDVSKETQKELEAGFNGISISNVLNTIADIGKEIINQFLSWFTGSEDIESNFAWLGEQVSNMIKSIPAALQEAASWVILQLGDLWNGLYLALVGEKDQNGRDEDPLTSRVKQKFDELTKEDGVLSLGISNIVELAKAAFGDAKEIIGNLWSDLSDAITGKEMTKEMTETLKNLESSPASAEALKKQWSSEGFNVPGIKSEFEKFVDELGKAIDGVFRKIPGWITKGLNFAVESLNTALTWLSDNLTAKLLNTEDTVAENVDKDSTEASDLQEAFTKLGKNISDLIFVTIPKAISAGFENVKDNAVNVWWPSLLSVFDSINNNTGLQEQFSKVGDDIVSWIDELPEKIKRAFAVIKYKITQLLKPKSLITDTKFSDLAKESLDSTGNETEQKIEQSTLWSTITESVKNIGDAFKSAFDTLWPDVSGWFANLPTYIVEGLTSGVKAIDGAIDGIGSFFTKLVDSKEAKEMAAEAMEKAQKATEEGVESTTEKSDQTSAFVTAITGLGSAIWTVITESIPKAIISGFNWVRDNTDVWIDSLKTIFAKIVDIDEDTISVESIKNKIVDTLKSLPGKLVAAWEDVKKQISSLFESDAKKSSPFANIPKLVLLPGDTEKSWLQPAKSSFDDAAEKISEGVEESDLFSTLWGIGTEIGKIIQSGIDFVIENFGPTILNGWNKSLEFITHLFDGLAGWFSGAFSDAGEALTNAFNDPKYDGLKEGIKSLGGNIEKFLFDTIPGFIGSALAKIILTFPDLIKKVFASFDETWKHELESEQKPDAQKVEGVLSGITDIGEKIFKFIGNLTHIILDDQGHLTNTAVIIGAIALVGVVASAIGNLFDSFRGVDGAAVAKNSLEGVLRSLINMMTVWLLVAAYSAKLNDTEYERVLNMLDRMESLVNRVLEFYAIVKGAEFLKDGISGLFNLIVGGKSKDKNSPDAALNAVKQTSEKVGTFQTIVGGVVDGLSKGGKIALAGTGAAVAVDAVGTAVNSVFSQFLGNFDMMGELINGFNEKLNSTLEEINTTKEKILAAIDVLNNVLELVNLIIQIGTKKNGVLNGTSTIRQINGPLALLASTFKGDFHAKDMVQSLKDIIAMKSDIVEFVEFMNGDDTFSQFKYAVASLGNVLSFFDLTNLAGANSITDEQIAAAVDVITKLLGNDELIGLAKDLTPEKFGTTPQKLNDGTEMLILFASSISRLAKSIGDFPEEAKQNLIDFFEAVSEIAFVSGTDNTEGTMMLAEQMISLGTAISSFSESVKDLNMTDIEKANSALTSVANLAQMLDSVGVGILQKIFSGGTSLQEFAAQLKTLGSDLSIFMNHLSPMTDDETAVKEWSFNNVASAMYGLNQLVIAASRLDDANVNALQKLLKDGGSIGSDILNFLAGISGATAEIDLKGSKDMFKIVYSDFDINMISGFLDSFQKICNALGSLKGIDLDNIIKALAGYDWKFGGSDKKGIAALITQLNSAFIKITAVMRTKVNDETAIDVNVVNSYSEMVHNFLSALGSAYTYIASDKVFKMGSGGYEVVSVESMMTQMVEAFSILNKNSDKLFEMVDTLASKADNDKIDKAKSALEVLKNLGIALSLFGGQTFTGGGTGFMTNYVNDGLNNLQVLSSDTSLLTDALSAIFTNLETFISNEQNIESLKASGRAMAAYLFEGMQDAFNTDENLKLHIVPVFDPSGLGNAPSWLGSDTTVSFSDIFGEAASRAFAGSELNTPIDYTTTLSEINTKLDKLTQLDSINDNTGAIIPAFAGARLVVDTNALAVQMGPAMDRWLATAGYLYLRHNS